MICKSSFKNKTIVEKFFPCRELAMERSARGSKQKTDQHRVLVPVVPQIFLLEIKDKSIKLEGCATAVPLSRGVNRKWYIQNQIRADNSK